MNKLPPVKKGGGKGGKDEDKDRSLGETKQERKDQDLLSRARKRFDRCVQAESENRKLALDDLKFYNGEQWPSDVQAQRNADRRPCLTINKIPTLVKQITNDLRQNRPAINISPVGDKGDREVAKMYRGLVRAIERDCHADIAYDTAAESAVRCGIGFWRIVTEFESPESFDQTIVVRRIRNPFTVYLDPDHQEPDGSDAKHAFVSEMIPRSEFSELYPDADQMPWSEAGIGETLKNWIQQDAVRVAEYFEVGHKTRTLVALSNGHVGWEDELAEEVKQAISEGRMEILRKRESQEAEVKWYKLTATEVIERKEWPGRWIPMVKVIGDEIDIEGKVKLNGVVRHAKDPQRQYNYWTTLETELIALAPKAPFIGAEGQFEGHESEWRQANTKSFAYLQYVPVALGGKPVPAPQRQPFTGSPQGVVQAKQGAANDMMATTGVRFDSSPGERMIDESGKAIRELRRSGDIGSFHFVDNLSRSLRHTGAIFIDLIPKVFDTKRMLTILREDDQEERVQVDPSATKPYQEIRPQPTPQQPQPKTLKIFNPTYGRYGCTVTIGPSYATKRIEASESMVNFAKAVPQIAPVIADIIAKNQDWPGADEIAKRLAKTLPPNLLTPDQKDVPPQVQALLQSLSTQVQQLGIERQKLIFQLNERMSDRAQRQDEIDKAFQAKIMALQEKFAEALMKVEAKSDEAATKAATEAVRLFIDSAHKSEERGMKTDLALLNVAQQMSQPPAK